MKFSDLIFRAAIGLFILTVTIPSWASEGRADTPVAVRLASQHMERFPQTSISIWLQFE